MRISDWSSDVCSSDLIVGAVGAVAEPTAAIFRKALKDIFDILAVPCGIVDVRILWALGCHEHIALILLRREFTSSTGEQDHDCDQHSAAKEKHGGAGRQRLREQSIIALGQALHAMLDCLGETTFGEIGRASCRERGGQ